MSHHAGPRPHGQRRAGGPGARDDMECVGDLRLPQLDHVRLAASLPAMLLMVNSRIRAADAHGARIEQPVAHHRPHLRALARDPQGDIRATLIRLADYLRDTDTVDYRRAPPRLQHPFCPKKPGRRSAPICTSEPVVVNSCGSCAATSPSIVRRGCATPTNSAPPSSASPSCLPRNCGAPSMTTPQHSCATGASTNRSPGSLR